MALSEAHKENIRKSWKLVESDIRANGVALFINLFTKYPQYKDYFVVFRKKSLQELEKSAALRAHGSNVMFNISAVVDSLDDPECLVEIWRKVIRNHIPRGMNSVESYEHVFDILLALLSEKLGDQFDAATKEAWTVAAGVLLGIIKVNQEELLKESKACKK